MRRILTLLLCAVLLAAPVRAADTGAVALTFDDGPSGRFTRRLLTGLEERDAKATFLLCGYRMELYPELTQRILDEGHEIGLHGYSHRSMAKMSRRDLDAEIRKTAALLPEGCSVRFLRPPGGLGSDSVCIGAENAGLAVLYWSVDPQDWATEDADLIVRRVVEQTRDGDVILLHDLSDSSVNAALRIVDTLKSRGFRFVTVSELAAEKGIKMMPGTEYYHFR